MANHTYRSVLTRLIPEATTPTIRAELRDELGVLLTSLTTATLALYDVDTGTTINGHTATNLLAGGLNVIAGGVLLWTLSVGDTAIVNQTKSTEKHIALITMTWAGGTKTGRGEIQMRIANLAQVP